MNSEKASAVAFFLEVVLIIGFVAAGIEIFVTWWKGKR